MVRITPEKAERAWTLLKKATNQWLDGPEDRVARPAFVFGCQRSGTTMTSDVLERSPHVWVWREKSPIAYSGYRLRSPAATQGLLAVTPAEVAVFKPLCDTQYADRILDAHPGSVGVWLARHWHGVARSAVAKWGAHQREVVQALAAGRAAEVGWRGERVPPALVAQLAEVVAPELSDVAGAALFWYVRSTWLFTLGLSVDPRVHLARYEDLVLDPERGFGDLCAHLGIPFDPALVAHVRPDRALPEPVEVPGPIARLCDALQAQIDEAVAEQAESRALG